MRAVIGLVEGVLRGGAPPGQDWRDLLLDQQPDLDIQVTSTFYPQLGPWFDRQVTEWRARHRERAEAQR